MRQHHVIRALLVAVTLGLYSQAATFDFVTFDDHNFITANPIVQQGLTMRGVAWAFGFQPPTGYSPLSWLSHMLDCQVFGARRAAGHHAVNILLHAANAALLYSVLVTFTGAMWRSAAVAALFAVHPLHVESVAWVSERRDVLSMCFCLLTLLAYHRYTRAPSKGAYALMTFCFALALLAKPMAVTLPCAMLLLDHWPLRRDKTWRERIAEKTPLLTLSALFSVLTLLAQNQLGAVVSLEQHSLAFRLQSSVIGYSAYLEKAFWPAHLAVHYPFPSSWPLGRVWIASAVVLGITSVAVRQSRVRPFLIVGWLWYLGTMLPMIGVISIGNQWMADRFAYLPMIGIYIMVVWGAGALKLSPRAVAVAAAAVLLALGGRCHRQIAVWRNSTTLYEHGLTVSPHSALLNNNLGAVRGAQGRHRDAIVYLQRAVKLQPQHVYAHVGLGTAYINLDRLDSAVAHLRTALRLAPDNVTAHVQLGKALVLQGRYTQALAHLEPAARMMPNHWRLLVDLAVAYGGAGRPGRAADAARRAIAATPPAVRDAVVRDLAPYLHNP